MPYKLEIPEHLDKIFIKLSKKDKLQFEILSRRIKEILEDPYRFKPLTANMVGQRRASIRHFVLTYEILENEKIVKFYFIGDHKEYEKWYKKFF